MIVVFSLVDITDLAWALDGFLESTQALLTRMEPSVDRVTATVYQCIYHKQFLHLGLLQSGGSYKSKLVLASVRTSDRSMQAARVCGPLY